MKQLNPNLKISDQIKELTGENVELILKSGASFKGIVAKGVHATVLLKELSGEEYYSALITVDQVVAVKVREVE